jgi:hypothetical protein
VGVGEEVIGSQGAGMPRPLCDCPVETVIGWVVGERVVCGGNDVTEGVGHDVKGLVAR